MYLPDGKNKCFWVDGDGNSHQAKLLNFQNVCLPDSLWCFGCRAWIAPNTKTVGFKAVEVDDEKWKTEILAFCLPCTRELHSLVEQVLPYLKGK